MSKKKPETPATGESTGTRAPDGKFRKGTSGNPGGRPKADARVKELAREWTETAINALVEVCKKGKDEKARVAAANALLDRAWGKPAQSVEVETTKDLAGLLALAFQPEPDPTA